MGCLSLVFLGGGVSPDIEVLSGLAMECVYGACLASSRIGVGVVMCGRGVVVGKVSVRGVDGGSGGVMGWEWESEGVEKV